MPIVIFWAGCAAAPAVSPASAHAAVARMSWVRMIGFLSEPIDPLLGVDPALQVADLDAARLGLGPRVERLARSAELVVDDAEVDQRLGRVAAEALHRAEAGLAERQRCAVHRNPALDVAGGVL